VWLGVAIFAKRFVLDLARSPGGEFGFSGTKTRGQWRC
jgi:hypothetical protein